jgi:CRISPR/Cas system-associated protein Cas10 (large subunit of type III CRISPR-Cas system)
MDGDKMGASLSNLKKEEDHRAFSKSLAEFAIGVQSIVERYQGKLIYAGGDDVLAVVSAKKAVECAEELANAFKETMKKYKWKDEKENKEKEISASAGIAIGHKKVPLQDIVHAAHKAESRAKTTYDRGALAITVLKRSGEIIEWGCKWNSNTLKLFKEINGSVEDEAHGFAYKLDAYLKPLALDKKPTIEEEYLKAIVKTEFIRLCDRTDVKVEDPEQLKKIASESIDEVFSEGKYRPQDFVNTFLCEAFINRPREEK